MPFYHAPADAPPSNFITLRVFITNNDEQLKKTYKNHIAAHNQKSNSSYPDAGFDIFMPKEVKFNCQSFGTKVPLGVKCAAFKGDEPVSFYTYPRSSMGSKTKLRLSNGTGIIDSGYRGELIGVFDNFSQDTYETTKHQRLLQICAGDLQPFLVEIVESEDLLGFTERGEGGFGSTGS